MMLVAFTRKEERLMLIKGWIYKNRDKSRAIIAACFFVALCSILTCFDISWAKVSDSLLESSWFVDLKEFSISAHGTLSCEVCHGVMDEGAGGHPVPGKDISSNRRPTDRFDYFRCRKCHRESYGRFLKGSHAEALKKEKVNGDIEAISSLPGDKRAPTCGHCHSSHYEEARLGRVEAGRRMTEVCGACHSSQKKTYLKGFHGKTAHNLGDMTSAYCSDCHGAHTCISLKEKDAALKACLRCHQKADASFASFVIHPASVKGEDSNKVFKVAVIRTVTVVMGSIVLLIIVFFYGHSFLWILRELHEKLRRH
ncbi:MAG: hypothetical protein COZ70_03520 [Deltaproteobacteria bacterium CG_4_8_14_3_um_filter_51_11]|nr:MAG: hypothetical protein COX16_01075 [Deltaproteobacteria bacterium CG23_combo_of_CG06-09_8_20_14_all_51_20]PIX20490.1 MAG: hypothetical protein COZ70_03520 [Deltaproteobacteria bacterium CG_4_8_14_3_um_filter_51_11]PJB33652.1 MAG: hypothetical protein CO107_15150 [Deltaproteobacteria bacterium CG_4_9_14_3_um_filter_51_14]